MPAAIPPAMRRTGRDADIVVVAVVGGGKVRRGRVVEVGVEVLGG